MSTQTIRILIAGALFVHGVGHTLGFWRPSRSWLLPRAGESTLRIVSSVIWILAAVGFISSSLGFWGIIVPADWWRPLAVVSAIISLAGLGLFWGTWPAFNTAGALAMDLAVLVCLLWLNWPPVEMFGR